MAEGPIQKEVVEEVSKADILTDNTVKILDELCDKLDDFKSRLFQGNNYKKKLPTNAPGKREFNQLKAQVRKLEKPIRAIQKKHKPPTVNKKKTDSQRSGFNRLVYVSKELTKFLSLEDYGLICEDGVRGVATPGTVTRLIVNYIYFMRLPDPKKMSFWTADDTIRKLFEHEWASTNVDPSQVTYTGLQKLISPHLETIGKEAPERRDSKLCDSYYATLNNNEGQLGAPSHAALTGRKALDEIGKKIIAMDKQVRACRKQGLSKNDTAPFEEAVNDGQKRWAIKSTAVIKICKENGFPISKEWPTPVETCLDE